MSRKKFLIYFAVGAVYGALAVLFSRVLIHNLGDIFSSAAYLFGMNAETAAYVTDIITQLHTAELASPWLYIIPACAVLMSLTSRLRIKSSFTLWLFLFIPISLISVCLTDVNTILFLSLIKTFLPLVSALL